MIDLRSLCLLASALSMAAACATRPPVAAPTAPAVRVERAERSEPPPHPVLLAYRETLREWMTEDEQRLLDEVSMADTMGGDSQRLRWIAADRTIREVLPLALEAQQDPALDEHADRLRALPPLLNRDVDWLVRPVVARAIRALTVANGTVPSATAPATGSPEADRGVADGTVPSATSEETAMEVVAREEVDPAAAREYADALAEYTEAYSEAFGSSPLHADAAAAAAADAVDAGFVLRRAVDEHGADRERAVRSAVDTLRTMAEAARRRERMPTLSRDPEERPDRAVPAPAP